MTMAHRIAIMDLGKIRQVASPDEIYEQPNSRFTAEFIGQVNLLEGKIVDDEKDFVTIRSPAMEQLIHVGHGVTGFEGMDVALAVRPEKIVVSSEEPAQPHNKVAGVIEEIAYLGSHSVLHVRLPGGMQMLANVPNSQRWASERFTWNDRVWLSWHDLAGVVLNS